MREKERDQRYQQLQDKMKQLADKLKLSADLQEELRRAKLEESAANVKLYIYGWCSIYNLTIEIKPDDEKISYLEQDECEGHKTLEMCRNDQKCKPKLSGDFITDKSGNRKWMDLFQCFACERFGIIKEHIRKKSIFKSKFNDSLFQIVHGLIFESKTRRYGYKYFIFKAMRTNYLYIYYFQLVKIKLILMKKYKIERKY